MWRFRRSVDARVVADHLFVLSPTGSMFYDDPEYAKLAVLLDGTRTAAGVTDALSDEIASARVVAMLRRLYRDGHIVRGPVPASPAGLHIEAVARPANGVAEAMAGFGVAVTAVSASTDAEPALTERIAASLRLLGCDATATSLDPPPDADLTVTLVDDYLNPELNVVNTTWLTGCQHWTLVRPYGPEVWVGPRFTGRGTGCWRCLAARLTANQQVERFVARQDGLPYPALPAVGLLPGVDGMVAAVLGAEIIAIVADGSPTLVRRLRTIRLRDFEQEEHHLVPIPDCPACGDPLVGRRSVDTIEADIKDSPEFGRGWPRLLTPTLVHERLDQLVSRYLGVVTRLSPVGRGGYLTGHTVMAKHDFPTPGTSLTMLRRNLQGQSGGRGRTLEEATAGALCESIERCAGVWVEGTASTQSSWHDLNRRAVYPGAVMLYSEHQYASRDEWNADASNLLQRVPEPLDETRPIDFTEGWSLTCSEPVLVPSGLVWYGHPDLREHAYAGTDSNGCAAGGSLAEAILHGLGELYERDAVAIWWYNRIRRPAVDLDAVDDALGQPYAAELRRTYADNQRELWVLDISTDLAMPCYAAVSRRDHSVEDIVFGFGAHPDPAIAVRTALMEMDQLIPMVRHRNDDGSTRYTTPDPAAVRWFTTATCRSEPWLRPAPSSPVALPRPLVDPTRPAAQVIEFYVDDLRQAGIETIVVDQSRPDIDLHVARTLAPGLRHFWRRTAPGRLFDVPVAQGWRATATPEPELNRWNVFV